MYRTDCHAWGTLPSDQVGMTGEGERKQGRYSGDKVDSEDVAREEKDEQVFEGSSDLHF